MYSNIVALARDDELNGSKDEVDFLFDLLETIEFDDEWDAAAGEEFFAKMRQRQTSDSRVGEENVELLRQLPFQLVS